MAPILSDKLQNLFTVKYKLGYDYEMSISSNTIDFFAQAVIDFYENRKRGFEFEFQDGNRYPHDILEHWNSYNL